jgi:heme/copper-type cytochrome/quinol oxidase subunit 2
MTEYELIDVLNSTLGLLISTIVAYVSFVSAYLLVAYVVGRNLSKQQTTIVSTLFMFGAGLTIIALWGLSTRVGFTVQALYAENPDYPVYFPKKYREALVICCLLGLVASLQFMWKIRQGH